MHFEMNTPVLDKPNQQDVKRAEAGQFFKRRKALLLWFYFASTFAVFGVLDCLLKRYNAAMPYEQYVIYLIERAGPISLVLWLSQLWRWKCSDSN